MILGTLPENPELPKGTLSLCDLGERPKILSSKATLSLSDLGSWPIPGARACVILELAAQASVPKSLELTCQKAPWPKNAESLSL